MTEISQRRMEDRVGYLASIEEVLRERTGEMRPLHFITTFEDMGLDSLDFADLILGVDDKFAVEIPMDEAAKFKTMGDLVDWLEVR